ncbi:MAG TPA: alpha/beta hydrolase [Saprospiraceae bacterium]|nr:alpha/beta hydrolase [Saprospiraceae bacterium]
MRKTILAVFIGVFFSLAFVFILLADRDIGLESLIQKYATPPSEFIRILDMDVHYRKQGYGDRHLVLIHGTGASLHTWEGWVEQLQNEFIIHSFDLPAFGLTGPSKDRDYSMKAYVNFLDQLISQAGIHAFALAGNSLGGQIAWEYTLQHPEKVTHLVLIDAAGYPKTGKGGSVFRWAKMPVVKTLLKYITPRSVVEKNLKEVYANQDKVSEDLVERYHDLALRKGNRQALIDRIQTPHQDNTHQLSQISCPTLIIWGAQDFWIPLENAKKFENDIPDAKVIIYPDLGHVPMEENPELTAQDVKYFLLGTKEVTI